jgi:hypothetical protein
MRKVRKFALICFTLVTIILLIILLLIKVTPKPPVGEMKNARETLSNSGTNNAETYSIKYYNEAKSYYDSAMTNWKRENTKFLYFRDYDRVSDFAELSLKKARQASENSVTNSSDLRIKVKQKIDSLNDLVADINKLFTSYPLSSETRSRISNGKFLLKEAEIAYGKKQYLQADRKIGDSEDLLTGSYENSIAHLKNYFKSYPLWVKWIESTIKGSKQNRDYSIIIDKFSRKCYVYLNGIKKYEFKTELGHNWVGDKRMKGDKTTPEGMYKIIKKYNANESEYYKALLLDFPNDEDQEKFRMEIARGTLPATAKIGGMIEIHGNGGKGIDWTEGCIALTDREMDLVFDIAKVGTPVTIVGSTVDIQHVLDK